MPEEKDYHALYISLFGATEDALELLDQNRVQDARDRLIQAQRDAEEKVISD